MERYAVIDSKDKVVIYAGNLEECELVQDTQYGGLEVLPWELLTDEEKETFLAIEPVHQVISMRGSDVQ